MNSDTVCVISITGDGGVEKTEVHVKLIDEKIVCCTCMRYERNSRVLELRL